MSLRRFFRGSSEFLFRRDTQRRFAGDSQGISVEREAIVRKEQGRWLRVHTHTHERARTVAKKNRSSRIPDGIKGARAVFHL